MQEIRKKIFDVLHEKRALVPYMYDVQPEKKAHMLSANS